MLPHASSADLVAEAIAGRHVIIPDVGEWEDGHDVVRDIFLIKEIPRDDHNDIVLAAIAEHTWNAVAKQYIMQDCCRRHGSFACIPFEHVCVIVAPESLLK